MCLEVTGKKRRDREAEMGMEGGKEMELPRGTHQPHGLTVPSSSSGLCFSKEDPLQGGGSAAGWSLRRSQGGSVQKMVGPG